MAETITAIVGALMQMQVGPLARAVAEIDPESDAAYIPPDATLGEMTGRDPEYAERMGADVRATTRMAGHAASALAAYAPVLKDMARSEEHTSELQSLMRISYAVFCLKKKKSNTNNSH